MAQWMTYDEWMQQVDAAVWRRYGVSADDLADFRYEDCYEDGATPAQAAKAAFKYDQGEEDDE